MAAQSQCAHDGCSCRVEGSKAFIQDGRAYCSSACAAGGGCEHGDCHCGGQKPG